MTDIDEIYGHHSVVAALTNPRRKIKTLWATTNAAARLAETIPGFQQAVEIVHPRSLDARLGRDAVHQGVLLEALPLAQPRLDQIPKTGIILLLDQVTDPHNVGAIIRSCAAFGVTALVTTARHSATASGVLFKAASGGYESVPYVMVTNLARAMQELRSEGVSLIGLDSAADTPINVLSLAPPLGLVLGAEGKGLRQLTRATCDGLARLALPGSLVSLNVSNAAAVALFAATQG